jgi:hypothetical protein
MRRVSLATSALLALATPGSALGAAYRPPPTTCARNPHQPSCDGLFADVMTIVAVVVIALIGLAWGYAKWPRPEGAERLRRKLRRRRIARALRLDGTGRGS